MFKLFKSKNKKNESHKNRDKVFMEQEESRAVRTKKWLFINRFNKEGMDRLSSELYDLEILQESIHDLKHNLTLFLGVKKL